VKQDEHDNGQRDDHMDDNDGNGQHGW
jgi:hypothetical protein